MEESSVGGTTSRFRITTLRYLVLADAEANVLKPRWTLMGIIKNEVLTGYRELKTDEVRICILRRMDTSQVLLDTSLRGAP